MIESTKTKHDIAKELMDLHAERKAAGHTLRAHDDPRALGLGFHDVTANEIHYISIVRLKESRATVDADTGMLFRTSAGREHLFNHTPGR